MKKLSLIMVILAVLLLGVSFLRSNYKISPAIPSNQVGIYNVTGDRISNISVIDSSQNRQARNTNLNNKPLRNRAYQLIDTYTRQDYDRILLTNTDGRIYRINSSYGRDRMIPVFPETILPAFKIINNAELPIVSVNVESDSVTTNTLSVNETSPYFSIFNVKDNQTYTISAIDDEGMRYFKTDVKISDEITLPFTIDDRLPVITIENKTAANRALFIRGGGSTEWIRLGGTDTVVANDSSFVYQLPDPIAYPAFDIRMGTTSNITTALSFTKYNVLMDKDQTITFTAEDRDPRVTIINRTGHAVNAVYIRQTGANTWGSNRISGNINNEQSIAFTLNNPNVTRYDIRISGPYGWYTYSYTRSNLTITGDIAFAFTPDHR